MQLLGRLARDIWTCNCHKVIVGIFIYFNGTRGVVCSADYTQLLYCILKQFRTIYNQHKMSLCMQKISTSNNVIVAY